MWARRFSRGESPEVGAGVVVGVAVEVADPTVPMVGSGARDR